MLNVGCSNTWRDKLSGNRRKQKVKGWNWHAVPKKIHIYGRGGGDHTSNRTSWSPMVTGHLSEGSFVRNAVVQILKFDTKPNHNTNHNPNSNHNNNPKPIHFGQMTLRTSELLPSPTAERRVVYCRQLEMLMSHGKDAVGYHSPVKLISETRGTIRFTAPADLTMLWHGGTGR